MLSYKLLLSPLIFFFFVQPTLAQETYYFNEEFSVDRPGNQLDSTKWIVHPNNQTCNNETITEVAGHAIFRQCRQSLQFPYVISKDNPFPQSDFSVSIKFEYFKAAPWGNGIELVDKAPENGAGFTQLFGIGFWEDTSSGLNMRFQYKGDVVYSTAINRNPHIFKLDKEGSIYKMYLDDQLLFTSPSTTEKVEAIYLGNPSIQIPPLADWSWFRVDYIRVTQTGPTEIVPQPFLDLPWDITSSGKKFKDIVFDPNSWFDHKYPLQDYRCCIKEAINFKGQSGRFYKSHSGYDYASRHGAGKDTPVLAAAAGTATFFPEAITGGAGNTIKIDHGNGYQTWYEHLRKNTSDRPEDHQLVVYEPGKAEKVIQGQKIGLVGLSGNTTGYHIHLSVFKDINNNGDFSDDYPFGLVDPLGWEGDYTDPWEEYSLNGKNGAKSYKLFTGLTQPKTQQITPSGGNVINDQFTLTLPDNATNDTLTYKIEEGPFEKASEVIKSVAPSLFLSATNNLGLLVTNFNNPLNLLYDYSNTNLDNIKEETLSFYYFNKQTDLWEKISSSLNMEDKTISSQTTHFSQFAIMGELLDSTPPETLALLSGTKGNENWYLSDVIVSLEATDNSDGKGVSYSVYSLDGEHWNEYSQPLSFTSEGKHKLYFLSHDNAGNEESIRTVEFSIDKTPPEARIEVNESLWDLKITPIATDSALTKKAGKKLNEFTYTLKDLSGNTLIMEAFELNSKYIDIFKLYSLKYNSDPKITLPDNLFDTNYIFLTPKNKPETKIVNQNFAIKNGPAYIIVADILKNKTQINIIENKQVTKSESPGLKLLNIKTNQGKLEHTLN